MIKKKPKAKKKKVRVYNAKKEMRVLSHPIGNHFDYINIDDVEVKKQKPDGNIEKIKDRFRYVITKYENDFHKILKEIEKKLGHLGIEQQKIFLNNKTFYVADFYLRNIRLIIEIDGEGHDIPEQNFRDVVRENRFFFNRRIKTIRIKNKYIRKCKSFLYKLIKNRVKAGIQNKSSAAHVRLS